MTVHLLVISAFGPHAKGDRITDPVLIAQILADERAINVVRVAAPKVG